MNHHYEQIIADIGPVRVSVCAECRQEWPCDASRYELALRKVAFDQPSRYAQQIAKDALNNVPASASPS